MTHPTPHARPEQLLHIINNGLPPFFGDNRRPDAPQNLSSSLLCPLPVLGLDHRRMRIRQLRMGIKRFMTSRGVGIGVGQRRPGFQVAHPGKRPTKEPPPPEFKTFQPPAHQRCPKIRTDREIDGIKKECAANSIGEAIGHRGGSGRSRGKGKGRIFPREI